MSIRFAVYYCHNYKDETFGRFPQVPLKAKANECDLLELHFTAEQDGYVQVLVANESSTDTWFDNLEITYTPGLIVQEQHYDPWGLNLAGIEKDGDYPYQFNSGSEKQKDASGHGYFYETDFRGYDPQLGRFRGVDALADMWPGITPYQYAYNNPVMFSDPSGLAALPVFTVVGKSLMSMVTSPGAVAATTVGINAAMGSCCGGSGGSGGNGGASANPEHNNPNQAAGAQTAPADATYIERPISVARLQSKPIAPPQQATIKRGLTPYQKLIQDRGNIGFIERTIAQGTLEGIGITDAAIAARSLASKTVNLYNKAEDAYRLYRIRQDVVRYGDYIFDLYDNVARGNRVESSLDALYKLRGFSRVGHFDNGFFPLIDYLNGTTGISVKTTNSLSNFTQIEENIVRLGNVLRSGGNFRSRDLGVIQILEARVHIYVPKTYDLSRLQNLVRLGQQNNVTVEIFTF